MIVVADTHAHLYPCFDVTGFFAAARRHLTRIGERAGTPHDDGSCAHVLCLCQRHGESTFSSLANRRLSASGWQVSQTAEDTALRMQANDGFALFVIAARQVVTRERLEVLALAVESEIPDDLPAAEVLLRTRAAGGVAALPWSPGKWLGARGRTLSELLHADAPHGLCVADTALRPWLSREPRLFAVARKRGLALVAGSDPLPFAGEERHIGRYATVAHGDFALDRPSRSLTALLAVRPAPLRVAGSRRSWLSVAVVWTRHAWTRR